MLTGTHISIVVEEVLLLALVLYLLLKYAGKQVPTGVLLVVYFSWAISFSAFVAISADIYNVLNQSDQANFGSLKLILDYFWTYFYWVNFCLNM